MTTLLTEMELEVLHDDRDVVIRDGIYNNAIRLRPAQVLTAATSLLDMAEGLRCGIWRKIQPALRTPALNGRPASTDETFEQVARDFSVGTAEGEGAGDLVLEQWTTAAGEPGEPATLARIFMTPGQSPRVVEAMLEALRFIATLRTYTAAVEGLQTALDERRDDGRARPEMKKLSAGAVHWLGSLLRARRQASEADIRSMQLLNEKCRLERQLREAEAKLPSSKPRRRRRSK